MVICLEKIPDCRSLLERSEAKLADSVWKTQDAVYYHNFERVLNAFVRHRVDESHFLSVTGYGHDDLGREVTDAVFADALQAEAALVRLQIVSGTHALAIALNGCLKAGDTLLSITGRPYDTLEEVIGLRGSSRRSLRAQGVAYAEISIFDTPTDPLKTTCNRTQQDDAGVFQRGHVRERFSPQECTQIERASLIFIQRSRGYGLRPALTIRQIEALIREVKRIHPEAIVMVDNCYGEFTQEAEPTAVGADLMAGSLIKNPGGGIVPAGGYVAGRTDLVAACADALTCPGVGSAGGYTFNLSRLLLQGLYLSPGAVREAMRGMSLAALLFEEVGYDTAPHWQDPRSDIIQVLALRNPEKQRRFCHILQGLSPVGSHIAPVPDTPPGYADAVIMAGGTFIDGSTIELSADGPVRPPYAVYLQGGLTYAHARLALQRILETI